MKEKMENKINQKIEELIKIGVMKKLLIVFIFSVFIYSCNLIKSKETKLTEKEWYLFMENDSFNNKRIFYTKDNTPWSLKFNTDGTIDVTENGIKKIEKIHWKFSDNKEWLNIDYNNKSGVWHYILSSKELSIVIIDKENYNTIIREYYHIDGKWKSEDWVSSMNLMYKNTID